MFNPDKRINIHDLTIEDPEQQAELPFDPEKEITEEDWQEMRNNLKEMRGSWANWADYAMRAFPMKILGATDEELGLDEEAWQGMKFKLSEYRSRISSPDENLTNFPSLAMEMKCFYPERDFGFSETDWDKMKDQLKKMRENEETENVILDVIFQVVAMKILRPEENIKINEEEWEKIKKILNGYKQKKRWWGFAALARDVKILNPNFDFNLPQEFWESQKNN